MKLRLAIYSLILLSFVLSIDAGFFDFNVSIAYGGALVQRRAQYSRTDTPWGKDPSFLKWNANFEGTGGNLEVVVVSYDLLHSGQVGKKSRGGFSICCTETAIRNNISCIGKIIAKNDSESTSKFWHWTVQVPSTQEQVINFTESGVYFFLVGCVDHDRRYQVSGQTEWKNPYGYLQGTIVFWLPVYFSFFILYTLLFLGWCILCVLYRHDIMGLQLAITFVILVGGIENLIWAFNYTRYNIVGYNLESVNLIGAVLTSVKLTIGRALLLLVCLGYSITKPYLTRRQTVSFALVTILYFLPIFGTEYITVLEALGKDVSPLLEYLTDLALAFLSTLYFLWIFFALNYTMQKLKFENQTVKLSMYKKLAFILVIAVCLSFTIFILQFISQVLSVMFQFWAVWWVWEAYWEFQYFAVLTTIAIIWRPTGNNKRYAYSTQIVNSEIHDDTREIPLETINDS